MACSSVRCGTRATVPTDGDGQRERVNGVLVERCARGTVCSWNGVLVERYDGLFLLWFGSGWLWLPWERSQEQC
jgi:hypothetical protein